MPMSNNAPAIMFPAHLPNLDVVDCILPCIVEYVLYHIPDKIFLKYIVCVCVYLFVCASGRYRCLQRLEEGIGFLGNGVIGSL